MDFNLNLVTLILKISVDLVLNLLKLCCIRIFKVECVSVKTDLYNVVCC